MNAPDSRGRPAPKVKARADAMAACAGLGHVIQVYAKLISGMCLDNILGRELLRHLPNMSDNDRGNK